MKLNATVKISVVNIYDEMQDVIVIEGAILQENFCSLVADMHPTHTCTIFETSNNCSFFFSR